MHISRVITENLRGGTEGLLEASAAWIKKNFVRSEPDRQRRRNTTSQKLTTTVTKAAPVRTGGRATPTERHVELLRD